jgi:hypothetical protein
MAAKRKSLVEILLAAAPRERLDAEFVDMIRDFIRHRGGLKGMAYRTGFAMLEKARPGIVERAVQKLMPQFIEALQPLYEDFLKSRGGSFAAFLETRADKAAWALIAVADGRMEGASENARKYYDRFRSGAEHEVEQMMPALGALIDRHL